MKDSSLSHFDPRSPVCEQEVQKIIHLQNIANQMPDAFTDSKRITKSHIPAVNVPIRIDVPKGPSTSVIASESQIRLKHVRPLGSKNKNPSLRSTKNDTTKEFHEEIQDLINHDIPEEISEPETQVTEELSISSTGDGINLDRSKITVDNILHMMLHLTLCKEMRILNLYPSKNIDKDVIGQNGKKQFNQN